MVGGRGKKRVSPDWAQAFSDFLRFYPGYTIERVKRELTRKQFDALMHQAQNRPYSYVVWVDPKKMR